MSTTNPLTEAVQNAKESRRKRPLYEKAKAVSLRSLFDRRTNHRRFVDALADDLELEGHPHQVNTVEIRNRTGSEPMRALLVYPDGTRLFVGEDDTARDSIGLFGFPVYPDGHLPMVRSIEEAMDLLKPSQAKAAEMEGVTTLRQGEWFLVEADREPASEVYSGEVAERPFGPSPLGNHVPREWAIGVSEDEFLDAFEARVPERAGYFDTALEVFDWISNQRRFDDDDAVEIPAYVPSFDELRELAEPIFVRGTLRHRENDHYMENVGDTWHLAVTHDVEVYTADEYIQTVRVD